jgi:hypothetical protein
MGPGMGEAQENGIVIAGYTEYQSPEFSSLREEWGHYHPKTDEVEPEVGIAVVAGRTGHDVGTVVERATTQHTAAACRQVFSLSVFFCFSRIRIFSPKAAGPFPHIPSHI